MKHKCENCSTTCDRKDHGNACPTCGWDIDWYAVEEDLDNLPNGYDVCPSCGEVHETLAFCPSCGHCYLE